LSTQPIAGRIASDAHQMSATTAHGMQLSDQISTVLRLFAHGDR